MVAILLILLCACGAEESTQQEHQTGAARTTPSEKVSEATTPASPDGVPVVYFTSNISAEGLVKIYEALGWAPSGNVAIGMSSPSGKVYVHTAGTKTSGSIMYSDQDAWLEALGEMVTGVRDHVGADHIIYINVMNRLSVDCDCDENPAEPDMHDIGILASSDPVALDQACIDLVYQAPDSNSLVRRIESRNGIHTLEHAEEIRLGSRTYELVSIDE